MTNLKQYLENLKAIEARATPGDWTVHADEYTFGQYDVVEHIGIAEHEPEANAAFIAASRVALPKLIEALEETVGALEYYSTHDSVIKEAYHSNVEKQITCVHTFINRKAIDALAKVNAIIGEAK